MSELPPSSVPYASTVPYDQDTSSLNTLSIFFFIIAALQALGGLVGLIWIGFGLLFALVGASGHESGDAAAGATVGGMFACFGIIIIAIAFTFAFLNFLAARSLRRRKRITVCYIMAGVACLWVPLGTILGIFTFMTLAKPGVKDSFT